MVLSRPLAGTLTLACFAGLVLCAVSNAYIPKMFHGRPKEGLIGSPGTQHLSRTELVSVMSRLPPEQWFDQKLDHFNPADNRMWKQKYFTSGPKSSNVLFVMIGGEGPASPMWMVNGAWIGYAEKYNAVCLQLEHRFYGKSHPTNNTSVDNLRYLSSEQALYDLATFISTKKAEYGAEKVVTFGGSYSGGLSAWMRLKFPHLVDGAVASSAPLLAQVDFRGYFEVVRDSLNTFGTPNACNSAIKVANNDIGGNLQSDVGRKYLKQIFRLCDDVDIENKNDVANLYNELAGNFAGVVQYNKDNRAFEGARGMNITIDTVCGIMVDASVGKEIERYAKVNDLMLTTSSTKCLDFKYDPMIKSMQNSSWESEAANGMRQWTYQTCIEFGYYQSSDSIQQPFGHGFPIQFLTQQCADIYGSKFTAYFIAKAVNQTNVEYGAKDYKADKVVFVNGDIDPWHYLGITQSLPQAQAIYIPGTAHCADMYPEAATDPPELKHARTVIEKLVGSWLSS